MLVAETELTAELELVVETLLLEGATRNLVGLRIDRHFP